MAKKKPEAAPAPQELEVTEDQIALQAIAEASQEVSEARIDEDKKKEAYTKAKARTKEAEADLEQVIHDHTTTLPLFDKPRHVARTPHPETVEPAPAEAAAGSPAEPEPEPEPAVAAGPADDDESWRALSLAEFRLPDAILDTLNGRDLFTVGQYADWCRAPGNDLSQIKGLGPKKLEKLADHETGFWARWRSGDYLPKAEAPAATPGDGPVPAADLLSPDELGVAPIDPISAGLDGPEDAGDPSDGDAGPEAGDEDQDAA